MIKKWFSNNRSNFLYSLIIPVGLYVIILTTTDVITIILGVLIYLSILADKIMKDKRF